MNNEVEVVRDPLQELRDFLLVLSVAQGFGAEITELGDGGKLNVPVIQGGALMIRMKTFIILNSHLKGFLFLRMGDAAVVKAQLEPYHVEEYLKMEVRSEYRYVTLRELQQFNQHHGAWLAEQPEGQNNPRPE